MKNKWMISVSVNFSCAFGAASYNYSNKKLPRLWRELLVDFWSNNDDYKSMMSVSVNFSCAFGAASYNYSNKKISRLQRKLLVDFQSNDYNY